MFPGTGTVFQPNRPRSGTYSLMHRVLMLIQEKSQARRGEWRYTRVSARQDGAAAPLRCREADDAQT